MNDLSCYKSLVERYKSVIDVYNPQSYNLFKILNLESDEVSHSKILSFLIREDLDSFLSIIGESNFFSKDLMSSINWENITEVFTYEGRRMDIAIETSQEILIIENKIYANDGDKQLVSYYNHAQRTGKKLLLIYLNLDGSKPSLYSINDKENKINLIKDQDFKIISYKNHIIPWINNYLNDKVKAKNEFINNNLTQYLHTLKKICRIMDTDKKNRLHYLIENINEAKKISSDLEEIDNQIHNFWNQVSEKLKQNILFKEKKWGTHFKNNSIMIPVFFKERGLCNLYVEYKNDFLTKPYIAIWANDIYIQKLNEILGYISVSKNNYLLKKDLDFSLNKFNLIDFIDNKDSAINEATENIITYINSNKTVIEKIFININKNFNSQS